MNILILLSGSIDIEAIIIPILYEAALNCLNRPYSGRVGLLKQSPPMWAKFGASL